MFVVVGEEGVGVSAGVCGQNRLGNRKELPRSLITKALREFFVGVSNGT